VYGNKGVLVGASVCAKERERERERERETDRQRKKEREREGSEGSVNYELKHAFFI